jgi:hypothetical protein
MTENELEQGESRYLPASFTARPRPELLASLDDVREITASGSARPDLPLVTG